VLFDLDGLLADTEPLQKRAFEAVCRRYGGDELTIPDEVHATFVGKSDAENARDVVERFRLDVTPERLIEERVELYVDILENTPVPTMDGVREALDAVRSAALRLAVGSSSIRRHVEVSLRRAFETMAYPLSPDAVFDTIVCGDDPGIRHRKPAPDIYLQCAHKLGVPPEACVVLEDSASGIESARRAGIVRAIAVPNCYTRGHDFSRAFRVFRRVDDLLTSAILAS
jgi:pseudouridine-5'-monophosphatase